MSNLEDALRSALRRKDPAAGFAARVVGKAVGKPVESSWVVSGMTAGRTGRRPWRTAPWSAAPWWTAAVAAGLTVVWMGSAVYERWREERAGRQAMVALEIASEKLNVARDTALRRDAGGAGDSSRTGESLRKEHE